jgi:hypothetical protein
VVAAEGRREREWGSVPGGVGELGQGRPEQLPDPWEPHWTACSRIMGVQFASKKWTSVSGAPVKPPAYFRCQTAEQEIRCQPDVSAGQQAYGRESERPETTAAEAGCGEKSHRIFYGKVVSNGLCDPLTGVDQHTGEKEKHVSMRSGILGTTATLALAGGGGAAVTTASAAHAATFACGNTCLALAADNIGGCKPLINGSDTPSPARPTY